MMLWIVFCTIMIALVSEALILYGYGVTFTAKVAGWAMLATLISTFVPSVIPGLDGRDGVPTVTYSRVSTAGPTPSVDSDSGEYERSIIESCSSPITVAEKYSEGCGGGCIPIYSETPRKCNYEGPHDCIGTIKQKIARYLLSSDYLKNTRYLKDAADSRLEFIWPLQGFFWFKQGRVILAFSDNGNDGINISIPEGTQVIAAEGGEVAYAGSELKGYGNMVIIRHPNGFVTAYAHNGELDVKKGDKVKRGQTVARSGQSGNVGSPQLHFELRKGVLPLDPTKYLVRL